MVNNKINLFQRFIKSLSDFSFVNKFKNESVGKAIGFLILGYLCFSIVFGSVVAIKAIPVVRELNESFDVIYEMLPDFTISNGELSLDNGEKYKEVRYDEVVIIFDLENTINGKPYTNEDLVILANKNSLLIGEGLDPLDYSIFNVDLNNESLKSFVAVVKTLFIVVFIVLFIIGFIGIFLISALVWCVSIIINSVTNKRISSSDCYKIAIYSMVAPGLFTLLTWSIGFIVPYSSIVYILIAGTYSYLFINQYSEKDINLEDYYIEE